MTSEQVDKILNEIVARNNGNTTIRLRLNHAQGYPEHYYSLEGDSLVLETPEYGQPPRRHMKWVDVKSITAIEEDCLETGSAA